LNQRDYVLKLSERKHSLQPGQAGVESSHLYPLTYLFIRQRSEFQNAGVPRGCDADGEGFDTADLQAARTLLDELTDTAIAAEG
jgi:hypothetical protein